MAEYPATKNAVMFSEAYYAELNVTAGSISVSKNRFFISFAP
jgi:hypothetical protein